MANPQVTNNTKSKLSHNFAIMPLCEKNDDKSRSILKEPHPPEPNKLDTFY